MMMSSLRVKSTAQIAFQLIELSQILILGRKVLRSTLTLKLNYYYQQNHLSFNFLNSKNQFLNYMKRNDTIRINQNLKVYTATITSKK